MRAAERIEPLTLHYARRARKRQALLDATDAEPQKVTARVDGARADTREQLPRARSASVSSAGASFFASALRQFRKRHPGVELSIA